MKSHVTFQMSGPPLAVTAARLIVEADMCVRRATFNIEGLAKRNLIAVNAVDTGFLLNSVYSVTSAGSGFQDSRAAAQPRNERAVFLQSAALGNVRGGTGFVGVGASYGIYIEWGTVRAGARPFLGPAFDEAEELFLQDLTGISGRVK